MGGWTLRNCVSVGVCAVVLAATDGVAQVVASRTARPSSEQKVVAIPHNWRETHPFSARFPDTRGSKHVIDLAAVRFATDGLVAAGRGRAFREPDLATFEPSQVRQAFARGGRDLFIVQATDAKAQVTLRRLLQRSRIAILGYIPRNAYLVRLDEQARSLLAAQAAVFWIGLFQPAYRVAPDLDFILQADPLHELRLRTRFDGEDFASEGAVRAALAAVPDASVVDVVRSDRGWIARVDGPVTLARTLAAVPGCLWVERFREIHLHNNVARTSANVATGRGAVAGPIMDVEDVWTRGIHGEGQIAAASDTGLSTGDTSTIHADFGDGSAGNPVRVTGIAENDRGTWDDDYSVGGGHGTHTSGSIVGNGIRSGATPATNTFPGTSYAGIAPKAQYVFQSIMQTPPCDPNPLPCLGFSGTLYDLFLGPYNLGARVHSNSWGADAAGAYDDLSQDLDRFVWDHPDMVVTFSAGNSGADTDEGFGDGVVDPDSIASPGTAKNAITVGASESYRPDFAFQAADTDTCDPAQSFYSGWWIFFFYADPIASDPFSNNASGMAPFSSRGPTDDSRIKPDIVAPGAVVTSTRTDVNPDFEQWGECEIPVGQQQYYVNMGGTSMSNPLTAGAATLVRQYYVAGWHPNFSDVTNPGEVSGDGFSPSAALVKATLINGAWDMAPGQYGTDEPQPEIPPKWDRDTGRNLPNNAEGYGRVDVEASLFPHAGWGRSAARRMHVRDVPTGLLTGAKNTYLYGVGSSADSLVATLVWSDPYGDTAAAAALVNDLDLEVTSPSGQRYQANRLNAKVAAFVHDTVNNVEQVKVTVPETGQWTVEVVGTDVPGNGVAGSDAQPFALVLSAVSCAVPATPLGLTATVNGNNRIDLGWSDTGASEYHVYRGTAPGAATSLLATVTSPGFTDTTVAGGFTYYYVVKSVAGSQCESAASAEVSATAEGVCPLGPDFAGLTSVKTSKANCGVDLEWTAATAPCGGPITYSVYRSPTPGFVPSPANRIQAGLTTTSFTDTTGQEGTTYHYIVRATDDGNGVEDANTVEGTGTPVVYLYGPQDFEALADGSLAGWTVVPFVGDAADWRGVQTCGGKIFRFGGAGCLEAYAESSILYNQSFAKTPSINVPAAATNVRLSFSQKWEFEQIYDGAYLAVSVNGSSPPTPVPASAILVNPYNEPANWYLLIPVWDGQQLSQFINTVVDLDAACDAVPANTGGCAGKTVAVAFATVSDFTVSYLGWFIDDVRVTADVPGACTLAPQPVPFFTARSASANNLLEWQNPASGGYASAVVRFRTDGTFPISVDDGFAVDCLGQDLALGAYNSCSHSEIVNGTTYSYSLFVGNGAGVYSVRRTVAGTPFDVTGTRKWARHTSASSLAPPGVLPGGIGTGAVFALSNDRALHAMHPTVLGGSWPRIAPFSWLPPLMNAPAQHRPPVVPMADKTRIFLASQDGHAYAVDAHTGALLWTSPKLGDALQANPAGLFSDLKPGVPNLLFVGTHNATSANRLYALDPSTGVTVTSFDNGGGSSAIGIITGIAVDYDTKRVYFTSRGSGTGSSDTLWCLDASTGTSLTKLWSLNVGDTDGSPILHLGRIYVGTNAGEVKAIDPTVPAVKWTYAGSSGFGPVKGYVFPQFGSTPLRLFYSTTGRVWAIDAGDTSASPAWSVPTIPNPSTPLHVIGTSDLVVGSSNGTLYQLSTVNGDVTGSVSLGTSALGSPARDAVNGLIHVGSTAGVLHTVTLPLP